jgi:hypothetical protein
MQSNDMQLPRAIATIDTCLHFAQGFEEVYRVAVQWHVWSVRFDRIDYEEANGFNYTDSGERGPQLGFR